MIKEHDRVVLTVGVINEGLQPGDVGAVVHLYGDGGAYEVEFVALDGHTVTVVTIEASDVRTVTSREIPHARELVPLNLDDQCRNSHGLGGFLDGFKREN